LSPAEVHTNALGGLEESGQTEVESQGPGPRGSAPAIDMQVSAPMIGGAIVPSASGWLGQSLGLEAIPAATLGMAVMLLVLREALLRQGGEQPKCGE
jgi:hypothetical protein